MPTVPTENIFGIGFDAPYGTALDPEQDESSEGTVYRQIRDQLNATRARFNRLGTLSGATSADLSAALDPLKQQLGRTDEMQNLLSGLTGKLATSAVASTADAGAAAASAARLSGGGRFGGGGLAARTAARGAVDAATGKSAALSQALVQGQLGEANFQANLLQQRGGIAAALSQLLQQQAGLKEERGKLGVAMETELANVLGGALSVFGGIRGTRESAEGAPNPDIFGLI